MLTSRGAVPFTLYCPTKNVWLADPIPKIPACANEVFPSPAVRGVADFPESRGRR